MPDVPDGRTGVTQSCGIKCCIFQLHCGYRFDCATVDNGNRVRQLIPGTH
jgi:hypothetical protein